MSIIEKIKRHIQDEKQLAAYKIAILKSGDQKGYKKRLIMKEEDFINYDFDKISFSSLEELRSALLLFKASRESFDMKYGDSKKISLEIISDTDYSKVKEKILFLEEKCRWILDVKIKEINIVQNKTLQSLLKDIPKDIDKLDISKIKKIEGSLIGKKRARIQLLLFCFAKYMYISLKNISSKIIHEKITYGELKKINDSIINIFSEYKYKYYQYFNNAISELPFLLSGTMGENDYIKLIHPLSNIVDDIEKFEISKISQDNNLIFDELGRVIPKKSSDRSYGFNTNIKRVGNETINPYYIEIFSTNGTDMTNIFEKNFFNNYLNGEYFKALSIQPLQSLKIIIKDISEFNSYMNQDDYNYNALNYGSVNNITLSKENSIILVANTRSDSEHLDDSGKIIDLLINTIKNDYKEKFNIYLYQEDDVFSDRRERDLRKFLEPNK